MFGQGGRPVDDPLGGDVVEPEPDPEPGDGVVDGLVAELPVEELPDVLVLLGVVVDDGVAAPDINEPSPSPKPSVPAPTPTARIPLLKRDVTSTTSFCARGRGEPRMWIGSTTASHHVKFGAPAQSVRHLRATS